MVEILNKNNWQKQSSCNCGGVSQVKYRHPDFKDYYIIHYTRRKSFIILRKFSRIFAKERTETEILETLNEFNLIKT